MDMAAIGNAPHLPSTLTSDLFDCFMKHYNDAQRCYTLVGDSPSGAGERQGCWFSILLSVVQSPSRT